MRRSRQLVIESTAVAMILIMVTLGGSISSSLVQPAFAGLTDPGLVAEQYHLRSLALYYNLTLSAIGAREFENASFLLGTFHFANIPQRVNRTAMAANADLATVNSTVPRAVEQLGLAQAALQAKEYLNASVLAGAGCADARAASRGISDFQGLQTSRFLSLSVPTSLYQVGQSVAVGEVSYIVGECDSIEAQLPQPDDLLTISSPQTTVETGGTLALNGSLTVDGAGAGGQAALFYVNGTYFGSLKTNSTGALGGVLSIPFLYKPLAVVQAVVAPNATLQVGGAISNVLNFTTIFDPTRLVLADPLAFLPSQSFFATGNLTTTSGVPLAGAPVKVTFLGQSGTTTTDAEGGFSASLTVPANATDGIYEVTAAFAPQGVFGPSSNFTSIEVVHVPLSVKLSAPFSLAGFPTRLAGSATADGGPVPGAKVTVRTPWGAYDAVTNASGKFQVQMAVPLVDFAFAGAVNATAKPPEPYIASGSALGSMRFFNVLTLVFPAVVMATVTYEAERMGAFGRRRRPEEETGRAPDGERPTEPRGEAPELVALCARAMDLASARLGVGFEKGQTLREALALVRGRGPPEGYEQFESILLATEDFLYAREFDRSRIAAARADLDTLERSWK